MVHSVNWLTVDPSPVDSYQRENTARQAFLSEDRLVVESAAPPSQREDLERASASVESSGVDDGRLEDRYSADVVYVIRRASVELFRICHRDPTIANGPDREVIGRFLEAVREKYDLGSDRDEAVRETLARATSGPTGDRRSTRSRRRRSRSRSTSISISRPRTPWVSRSSSRRVERARRSSSLSRRRTTYSLLEAGAGRSVRDDLESRASRERSDSSYALSGGVG